MWQRTNQLISFLQQNKKSLISFAAIGTTTAIFYFFLFTLLWQTFHINYNIAISISYIVVVTYYFFANRKFAFKAEDLELGPQVKRYMMMLIFNYLVTISIVHESVELLGISPITGTILAIGVTFILSFLISKFWIFRQSVQTN